MKQTQLLMGMPITVEIADAELDAAVFEEVFNYLAAVDRRYSTYKPDSEISQINRGLPQSQWSAEMCEVLELCEQTKQETGGYFDIARGGQRDPSGLVKGWAIAGAAELLRTRGLQHFYVEAGGDIQTSGHNAAGRPWRVGIRNPFNRRQIVKVVALSGQGVATSGTYIRGQHVYDPHHPDRPLTAVASLTVVASNIYDADRFATAAFAMGRTGLQFIESLPGCEGYMIDNDRQASFTSGFDRYVVTT